MSGISNDQFLLEDYKLKVGYLTAHLQRMWTRFNFFVTIESALAAFLFTGSRELGPTAIYVAYIGAILSVIWYTFGAQDRYLVLIYRTQVRDTFNKLLELIPGKTELFKDYPYVGEVEETAKQLRKERCMSLFEWRYESFSITRLASIFPLFVLFLWLIFIGSRLL